MAEKISEADPTYWRGYEAGYRDAMRDAMTIILGTSRDVTLTVDEVGVKNA